MSLVERLCYVYFIKKEGTTLIEVRNLVKRYGDNVAVNNLNFKIESGKIYGFLGPNGAGKSTTMNIMTGYLAATSGEVLINGHDIVDEPELAKKSIGYLPEIPPLYMEMTVREYLKFAAELKKVPKAERKKQIDEVMRLVKITDMGGRLIRNLSKGYRQRVGLAQAILGYPEVIILDEPTVGLDPKQIIEVRDLIKNLSEKHTIILSSHILSEVSEICDHIMIISRGKMVASDSAANLSKGTSEDNILELTIKGDKFAIQNKLREVLQKRDIEVHPSATAGAYDATIVTPKSNDIREKLFFAMAQSNLVILKMNQKELSLEDIFLELTGAGRKTGRGRI